MVGFIYQGFFGTIKFFVPAKEGGFRDMMATAEKGNTYVGAVKFNSMVFCVKLMW